MRCRRSWFNSWVQRIPGEGNGNPFQNSCLGSPMDRGAGRATVHGVESWTQLVTKAQGAITWAGALHQPQNEGEGNHHGKSDRIHKSWLFNAEWTSSLWLLRISGLSVLTSMNVIQPTLEAGVFPFGWSATPRALTMLGCCFSISVPACTLFL